MNCSDCRFYRALPDTQCRLNPPTAVPVPAAGGGIGWAASFTPTRPEWWCGQWRSADDVHEAQFVAPGT